MIKGQGEVEKSELGSSRESNNGRGRFDLIPYEAMEALAKWYEESGNKYPERDWEKGISVKDCINRAYRHIAKAASGWTDEDHLAAVMWNCAAAITMMQRRPDCNDHIWSPKIQDKEFNVGSKNDHLDALTYAIQSGVLKIDKDECCTSCQYSEIRHSLCVNTLICTRVKGDIQTVNKEKICEYYLRSKGEEKTEFIKKKLAD